MAWIALTFFIVFFAIMVPAFRWILFFGMLFIGALLLCGALLVGLLYFIGALLS